MDLMEVKTPSLQEYEIMIVRTRSVWTKRRRRRPMTTTKKSMTT